MNRWKIIAALATTASSLASTAAWSQAAPATQPSEAATEDESGVDDIIVTAQRREETLQRVPIAVSAITGDDLRAAGAQTIEGLQSSVPNLNIGQNNGVARITIRGVGLDNNSPSAEGSIAFHLDGVYVQRSQAALAGLFDLARVEVLRGPQGTLYGRNATGGSINVITARPTNEFSGYIRASYGSRNQIGLEGAASGALIDDAVLARVSFRVTDRDGYGRNIVTGRQIDDLSEYSLRGQLQFNASDRFNILLTGDYTQGDDRSGIYHLLGRSVPTSPLVGVLLGGTVPTNPRDIASRIDPSSDREFWGINATATFYINDDMILKSITAFRNTRYLLSNSSLDPSSLTLFPVLQSEDADQFSQELQFNGRAGAFSWVSGLYYFHERNNAVVGGPVSAALGGGPASVYLAGYYGGTFLETDAYAAFGELTYAFSDQFSITGGLRYSNERKTVLDQVAFNFAALAPGNTAASLGQLTAPQASCGVGVPSIPGCDPQRSFDAFTPRVSLQYRPNSDILAYATFSRGFKSGTYNLGSVQGQPVNPETIDSYEVGLKTTLANGLLRANISAFHYDYTDLQVSKVVLTQLRLENAATARIRGVELELTARPSSALRFDASLAYLDARFRNYISADPTRPAGQPGVVDNVGSPAFNLAGNRLPQSPRWSGRFAAEYTIPVGSGELELRGDVSWSSRSYFSAFNLDSVSRPSMTQLGGALTYQFANKRTRLALTGRNLTNQTRFTNGFVATVFTGAPVLGFLNEPRSIVLSVEHRF
jgi:iron complex outermembrane recepter protein